MALHVAASSPDHLCSGPTGALQGRFDPPRTPAGTPVSFLSRRIRRRSPPEGRPTIIALPGQVALIILPSEEVRLPSRNPRPPLLKLRFCSPVSASLTHAGSSSTRRRAQDAEWLVVRVTSPAPRPRTPYDQFIGRWVGRGARAPASSSPSLTLPLTPPTISVSWLTGCSLAGPLCRSISRLLRGPSLAAP